VVALATAPQLAAHHCTAIDVLGRQHAAAIEFEQILTAFVDCLS
jgi:hypothetical protein